MKLPSSPSLLRFASVCLGLLVAMLVCAEGKPLKPEQPLMHAALDSLRAARSAVDPLPDLKSAKFRLKAAHKNKGGYRVEALAIVDKAIGEVNAKHRHEANKLIDQAVTKIERGIAVGN